MIEKKLTKSEREGLSTPFFYDRLFALIKEENENFSHGEFILKIQKNGIVSVLKSLGIYKTTGRGENKISIIHPRLALVINSTISDAKTISKTIIKLVEGEYNKIDNFNINFDEYNKLQYRFENSELKYNGGYMTYIIYNPTNKLTKIGVSKKIFKRYQNLCNDFGHELSLIAYCNTCIEKELHLEYKDQRVFGEWFDLDKNKINEIIDKNTFEVLDIKFLN